MIAFLADFADRFMSEVIGGSSGNAVYIASFLLLIVLLVVLIAANFPGEIAFIITGPAVFAMSSAGWLPPISLGAGILLFGLFWTGIIFAMTNK